MNAFKHPRILSLLAMVPVGALAAILYAQEPKTAPIALSDSSVVPSSTGDTASEPTPSKPDIHKIDPNTPVNASSIRAILKLRRDEPYKNVQKIIDALKARGIEQISFESRTLDDQRSSQVDLQCESVAGRQQLSAIAEAIKSEAGVQVDAIQTDRISSAYNRYRATTTQNPWEPIVPLPSDYVDPSATSVPPYPDVKTLVKFEGPAGTTISWENNVERWAESNLTLPATYDFPVAFTYRIKAQLPESAGGSTIISLLHMFPDVATVRISEPIQFDVTRLMNGFSPNNQSQQICYVASGDGKLYYDLVASTSSTVLADTLKQIRQKGKIAAVISVGNYDNPELSEPSEVQGNNLPDGIGTHELDLPMETMAPALQPQSSAAPTLAPWQRQASQSIYPSYGSPIQPNDPRYATVPLQGQRGNRLTPQTQDPSYNGMGVTDTPRNTNSNLSYGYGVPAAAASISDVKQRLLTTQEIHEKKSLEIAAKLRTLAPGSLEVQQLKGELQQAVEQSFLLRQELQNVEIADFAQRLETLKQSNAQRSANKQQIVERRVQDLLDPNLSWQQLDSTPTADPARP